MQHCRTSGSRLIARTVLTSLVLAAPLAAQDTTRKAVPLTAVEVVATRISEAPHDVPASIEVISGDMLRARGAASLRDALALATGVAIAPGGDGGPASAVPEFWGLREFDAFLLVVDDVPWGGALNPQIASLSLRDVERVEILRGPAPVTYGATSFVGVIHVVHKASSEKTRYVEGHGGSYGSGGGAIDLPIAMSGPWTSRLSADFDRQGFRDDNASYARGHGLWRTTRTTDANKLWFTADLNILRQDPASPHPREGPSLSSAVPIDANHNPSGAYLNEDRVALSAGFTRPVLHGAEWGTTASFTHTANRMFRGFLTDISNAANNATGFKENIDINDFYADSHIIWPAMSHVRVMAGADALIAAGEARGAVFTYTAPLNGLTLGSVTEPSTLDRDSDDERRFLGGYGSLEWRPTSRLEFTGGLRLNATTEKRGEGKEVTHNRVSGSVGVLGGLWEQGIDHVRVFANFRDTFKPAAFDFGLEENEGVLDPETSRSYEGGLKVRAAGGRVDFEASVFQMDFHNLVTPTIVNNLPALINSGSTRFKGVELETDLRLEHDVSVRGGVSFHDAKFVDFEQMFDIVLTQLRGNRIEMSAKTLASGGVTYAPPRGVTATLSLNYTGDRYLNKRNTALAPAFTTFDAGIGYRFDRAEVRIDARNVGDRRDAVSESEFGDAQYYRMTARTVRAGIVMKY